MLAFVKISTKSMFSFTMKIAFKKSTKIYKFMECSVWKLNPIYYWKRKGDSESQLHRFGYFILDFGKLWVRTKWTMLNYPAASTIRNDSNIFVNHSVFSPFAVFICGNSENLLHSIVSTIICYMQNRNCFPGQGLFIHDK